jgi:hypothetical protein
MGKMKKVLLFLIFLYQRTLSPLFGGSISAGHLGLIPARKIHLFGYHRHLSGFGVLLHRTFRLFLG